MGQGFMDPTVTEYDPKSRGFENILQDLLGTRMGGEAPQRAIPETPFTSEAIQNQRDMITRMGPQLEKFFYGMMEGGGTPETSSLFNRLLKTGQAERQNYLGDVRAKMPMGSTAAARAASAGGEQALNQTLATLGGLELDQLNRNMGYRFQGAGGLQGLPGFYSAPSSLEQVMFGMQEPARAQNFQSLMQERGFENAGLNRDAQIAQALFSQNYYQPEKVIGPSKYDRYISSWLNPLLQAGGTAATIALPFLV